MPLFPKRNKFQVNYNYYDTAEKIGYNIYYGAKGDDGEYLVVVSNLIYSEQMVSHIANQVVGITTFTEYFDLDFDLEFNIPKNIKGKIIANIPIGMAATLAAADAFDYYAVCKVYHVTGLGAETLLGTGTSRTALNSGSDSLNTVGTSFTSMVALCIADVSLKHFKKGEKIRFSVGGWFRCREAGATAAHIYIGHNPRNEEFRPGTMGGFNLNAEHALANEVSGGGTVTYQATQMSFHVPFILDL